MWPAETALWAFLNKFDTEFSVYMCEIWAILSSEEIEFEKWNSIQAIRVMKLSESKEIKEKKWACSLHSTDYNSINAWYGSYLNQAQWEICLLFFAKMTNLLR